MSTAVDSHQEKREKLVEAAFWVFSEKGFEAATNKDIATKAGVTPGLIYWYFKSKRELFDAVLTQKSPVPILLAELGDEDPRSALNRVALVELSLFEQEENIRILRLLFSEVYRFPDVAETIYSAINERVLRVFAEYLRRQISLGHLREFDEIVGAQCFFGSLISFVILGKILGSEMGQIPKEKIAETLTDIFLKGIEKRTLPNEKVMSEEDEFYE